jgi:tetratricopeptide (TPR) repeat protein
MPRSKPTSNHHHDAAPPPPRELSAWLALVVLAAAVWIVYGRSLDAPFIFDDSLSVLQNRSIAALWPLVGDTEHPGPFNPLIENPMSARPLVNLSLAANFHFGRFDPRGYRAVNVLLHMSSALLLWALVWRTLRLPMFGARFDRAAKWLALAVAALWALHPLNTEAVVYVTQRTELLVAFCYLGTLYASLRFWTAASPTARKASLLLATLACLAGAASKEVMVTAPLVVLLFERTFVNSSFRVIVRRSWPLYLGLSASWLVIAALQIDTPRSESAGFSLGVPLVAWWCTQAQIFIMYMKLAIWPAPLVIHYALPQLETFATAWPYVAAVASLAAVTFVLLWRRQPAGWLLACVFAILAPTHLVPIATEIAAERRMYLPLAALVALAVIGSFWLLERVSTRTQAGWPLKVVGTLAVLLSVAYGIGAARRIATFHDPVALWRENVELQPYNHVAQMNLASVLAATGNSQDAIEHYRAGVRAKPDFVEGRYHLGLALAAAGRLDEAITELREVVRRQPDAYKIHNNLGVVLFSARRLPEAIAEFEKSLELRPDFVEARENLNRARQQSVLPKAAQ